MKKNISKIIIFSCVVVSLTLLIMILTKQSITVYNIDLLAQDLRLKNLTIVSTGTNYYIPDNYIIEKVQKEDNIRDIRFGILKNDVFLTDSAFQFDHLESISPPSDVLKDNVKLNQNTNITIKFKYKLNGAEKENFYEIKLKDHIKHKQ